MSRILFIPIGVFLLGCILGFAYGVQDEKVSIDPMQRLEQDLGGFKELASFLSHSSPEQIQKKFKSYGISQFEQSMIDDCPQYFSSSLRNQWHSLSGERYYIDSSGRPGRAYAYLPPIRSEGRQSTCQTNVGRWGDAENPFDDYDGGHMIGSQLGGWGGRANLVPQDLNFNRGNWLRIENKAADCSSIPSSRLFYYIASYYPNSSALVPNRMLMYLEDRSSRRYVVLRFDNVASGGSNGTAEANRGIDFLNSMGCR